MKERMTLHVDKIDAHCDIFMVLKERSRNWDDHKCWDTCGGRAACSFPFEYPDVGPTND